MTPLPLKKKHIRTFLLYSIYALLLAMALAATVTGKSEDSGPFTVSKEDKAAQAEKRRQTKRMYSLFDHIIRICALVFLSAVFAGLTLGVMCADTFTLEIIAESGPAPDCNYAARVLPLRKQGHKTLCTLIVTNMLCNTLVVQEFSSVFDIVYAIRAHGNTNNVVDDSGSQLLNFIVSTFVIVIFAEIVPMSICKSKHSLMVAAAGSVFVRVAMVLTYPVSASLGKFLDWVVGTEETGQVYDRKELRKLMMIHYDHERCNDDMPKTELNLLLAAMDFQERKVKDIMTPIANTTYVNENDVITPDFVERLWLSGRSRVPVQSAHGEHFSDVLVVKDLLTVNISTDEAPLTVAQVVKPKNRLFAVVGESTSLPAMMKFFQDAKTHMAVVFADEQDADKGEVGRSIEAGDETHPLSVATDMAGHGDGATIAAATASATTATDTERMTNSRTSDFSSTVRRSLARNISTTVANMQLMRTVGIVTMEDVVEELLNDEIYDEYDRYEPEAAQTNLALGGARSPTTATKQQPPRAIGSDPHGEVIHVPKEPKKPPRANFYSYFTHPEADIPLTEAQVWAVAYFLSRSVKAFMLWPPAYIKLLLDDSEDRQLVCPSARRGTLPGDALPSASGGGGGVVGGTPGTDSGVAAISTPVSRDKVPASEESSSTAKSSSVTAAPMIDLRSEHTLENNDHVSGGGCDPLNARALSRFDHTRFLAQAPGEDFVMYAIGVPSEFFTLVLGGQIDMLVGREKFYSRLRSFQCIGEEALTHPFYAPDFSAIVSRAARVYRISKTKYEKYLSYQTVRHHLHSHLRVLRAPKSTANLSSAGASPMALGSEQAGGNRASTGGLRDRSTAGGGGEHDRLLRRTYSETAVDTTASSVAKAYGTFKRDKH